MTYCLATIVDTGLVFVSDSRTNAGIDQLGVYSKMHLFDQLDGRYFVLLSAGNLATTQAVVARLRRDLRESATISLATCQRMREAGDYVGDVSYEVQEKYTAQGKDDHFNAEANFIFGGQIDGDKPGLFHVYPQGNFVAPTSLAPFLQIGEQKYGKPVLDQIIRSDTTLETAARCCLVSMDATMRSNAGVGPPIELLIYRRDSAQATHKVFDDGDPYLGAIREAWESSLRQAFEGIPELNIAQPDAQPLRAITGNLTE